MGEVMASKEAKQYSPLALAFLGDAVYGLYIRERLIRKANTPVKKLHSASVEKVKATFQSEIARLIEPMLSDEEADVLRRGRNASTNNVPKGANSAQYHYATGLEALFGYLYLIGDFERMEKFIDIAWEHGE